MKKYHLLLLSILSGLLMAAAWPMRGFPGLLFAGFVPLLIVEDFIYRHPEKFIKFSLFFYSYPASLIWNGHLVDLQFNRGGGACRHSGECPFHDDHLPTLSFYTEKIEE